MGRELTDIRVEQFLNSDEDLNRYIDKGLSEIHWEGKKLGHFELIRKIMETAHKPAVLEIINQIRKNFDPKKLSSIINSIDDNVPQNLLDYKIPPKRKELIIKIIALRFKKLENLLNERI